MLPGMAGADKSWAATAVRLRTGRDIEGLLREYYVERRYSQQEIASALGVSRTLVRQWLVAYGMSRENRAPIDLER